MKINKILTLAIASTLMVGCADLDTEPMGRDITTDQKANTVENNPEKVSASVTGITTMFSIYNNVSESHDDFGYPSIMLYLDSRGVDMVGCDVGYNWFSYGLDFTDRSLSSRITNVTWSTLYNQIYTANMVTNTIARDTEDETLKFYLAQALALRAFDYFNLAQIFQFTYKGNEDAPCVPIITEENQLEAGSNGVARNTVQEVYDLILKDLSDAIQMLSTSSKKRDDKRYISLDVAYGLRARVNLVMQNWSAAAADAQEAIKNSASRPATIEEVSTPTFKDINESNWMWGILIAETDRVVTSGIVNWISHMGSLNYGYASVGAWRRINPTLYDLIGANDPRKGWFLNAAGTSANLNEAQQAYLTKTAEAPAYTQVKFAPYKDEVYTSTNANDVPLMRIEEMYLILAEAQAMAGDAAAGKNTLETFVRTYRDPSYSTGASTAEAVQNAVWTQRRIELWGEGLSYFDLLRLRKGVDRASTAWKNIDKNMPKYNYQILDTQAGEADAIAKVKAGQGGTTGEAINALIFQIPDDETESNPLINEKDNNLGIPVLEPVN